VKKIYHRCSGFDTAAETRSRELGQGLKRIIGQEGQGSKGATCVRKAQGHSPVSLSGLIDLNLDGKETHASKYEPVSRHDLG